MSVHARLLDERLAAKRSSATPMDELETMLVAAEAVLTETLETIEAFTVSALQQAHEMSHRPETTAEGFFQAHKDITVTSKEQARQKQLDFLESMKFFEEVYEDELPAGTHVMSGRGVDTMKTPTVWRSKYTARGYEELHRDEGCFAATATIQDIRKLLARCLDKRHQGLEAFVADYTKAFLNAEVWEGEQLFVQPPAGVVTKTSAGRQTCGVECAQCPLGWRTSARRWQEHLSNKLKERGFIQDQRDPCLSVHVELDICIGRGSALGHGDRQTTRVPGSFFVQDATRLQLWGFVRMRDTDVQGLWFWPTQGFEHTQFREKTPKVIPFWTTLDNAVTDSRLGDYSGRIVLTSKMTISTSSVC